MKLNSEINPIKSDSVEIDCQGIYDAVIACQRELDGNLVFEKNLRNTLDSIEQLLYTVNEVELFSDMIELIFKFKYYYRELENQMKYIDEKRINSSQNLKYILDEMSKFKEII